MTSNPHNEQQHPVQLLNEAVLRAAPTDALPVLLPADEGAWAPKQVILDYNDGACYAAIVHYDKSGPFEQLRDGINRRFGELGREAFAYGPEMGIWRDEEAELVIHVAKEDGTFTATYLCYVVYDTIQKLDELYETKLKLFEPGDDVAP